MRRAIVSKPVFVIWMTLVLSAGCGSIRTADERICANCSEPIKGRWVDVDSTYFHPAHFMCGICEKPIEEDLYIPYGGKHYHEFCYLGHIVGCAYCNEPAKVDSFVTYKGESYHSSCVREYVVLCAYCEQPTEEDTFVDDDGKIYHRTCFRKYIVPCAFCMNPIRDKTYTSSKGKNYHSNCYEEFIVLRCTLCRERIEGDYFSDYWGGSYHPSHKSDSPSCDFCGWILRMPLEGSAVEYSDGRYLCGSCHASAVTTVKEVKTLASEVSEQLRSIGIDVDVDAVSFHMVGAEEMRQLNRHSKHKLEGLTTYLEVVEAPGRTIYEEIDVYVLYGIPRVQMIATLAHELTHVWQLIYGRLIIYRTLSEGSCQYASYLVLKEIPGGESEYIIHTLTETYDRTYGDGFPRVKRYADENGISSWLTLLKNNDPLPKY